ncbi:hypothetical protein [Frankia sp. EAN1pec]|uniref:hypothetical protein n=1 Tax=Parafrankia sp. (strain EAN1pec) TaxID=298653 RepID=UPI0002E1EC7B
MTADLSVPTGVTRRREPVRRSEWLASPRAPGPYSLPVGHIVAIEITDDAAHRQLGIGYRSAGEQVWSSGWGSHVVEVLAEDAAGRGWWVEHCDRRTSPDSRMIVVLLPYATCGLIVRRSQVRWVL